MTNLNQVYLQYLVRYPLLTKSITTGVLCGLNESISSVVTKDYGQYRAKLIKMIIYGSFIVTPISHNLYAVLNKVFAAKPGKSLSPAMKILQLLTSLLTITPILSAVYTSWVSINNYYKPQIKAAKQTTVAYTKQELIRIGQVIKYGMKTNYTKFLKSSVVTSFSCLVVAQNCIPPQLWVVFFNVVYFVVGTYQNIRVKRLNKQKKPDT